MGHLLHANPAGDGVLAKILTKLYSRYPLTTYRIYLFVVGLTRLPVFGPLLRVILDWYASRLHQNQVKTFEEVVDLVEQSSSQGIGECPCVTYFFTGGGEPRDKCIRVGMGFEEFNKNQPEKYRPATKQELIKSIEHYHKKLGYFLSVTYCVPPNTIAICNCTKNCIAYKFAIDYGITNALNKGDKKAVINPEACEKCGACMGACHFNAIRDYRVDESKCMGCGVCRFQCPTESIKLIPRRSS